MNFLNLFRSAIWLTQWLLPLCLLFGTIGVHAQPFPVVQKKLVASGFNDPVGIVHAGDSRLFIVEQRGVIRILNADGNTHTTAFLDIRDRIRRNHSEQGLLGLAFHPKFDQNGYLYVNYTTTNDRTRISRFALSANNPNQANKNSEQILFTIDQPFRNHNGGDVHFGPDGYLYISLGDGGSGGDPGNRAQAGQNLLGKILRVDVDQSDPFAIPGNNPFVDNDQVADEVWSWGWRNPWRFSFDRQTGDMWIADVGQNAEEEVSFEPANTPGLNYGWRCREGSASFNNQNCPSPSSFVEPIFTYRHRDNLGRSITGGYVYRGSQHPGLVGIYFVGDYVSGNLWGIQQTSGGAFTNALLGQIVGANALSTFGEDAQGEVYVADYQEGRIYQLVDQATSNDPDLRAADIRVFPQPADESLSIVFGQPPQQSFVLSILDMQGRQLFSVVQAPATTVELDVSQLSPGFYLLSGQEDGRRWIKRLEIL